MTSQINSPWHSMQGPACWGDQPQGSPALQDFGLLDPGGEPAPNTWALAWSDLMMVLFVLFCVLFVYALNHQKTKVEYQKVSFAQPSTQRFGDRGTPTFRDTVGQSRSTSMQSLYARIAEVFSTLPKDQFSIGYSSSNHVTVRLKNKVLFEPGQSRLKPGHEPFLDRMASILGMVGNEVQVVGHVDPGPDRLSGSANVWQISAERAGSVVGYFVEEHGFGPERFSVQAFGNTEPLVPGLRARDREVNNRVEIRVMAPELGSG